MSTNRITARDITKLLAKRHEKDVFVPECKSGPTWGNAHLRLDGWAMKKSWAHPLTIGYEIKVARSDFLGDDKWRGYLQYCNEFYFVCPSGLIKPEELPDEIGLVYVSKTGTKLFRKRKAVYRDIAIPDELYRYILMSRTEIVQSDLYRFKQDKREFWEHWLRKKTVDRNFGYEVGRTLQQTINNEIVAVRDQNAHLQERMAEYDTVIEMLEAAGINTGHCYSLKWQVESLLGDLQNAVPSDLKGTLSRAIRGLEELQGELNKLEAPPQEVAHAS